jgi:flavin reductase (DIM6/NTAB) family NADH-FMN oxidoreductase RutF
MKRIEVKDLSENFFEVISKEWMLVTAGDKEKFNTMTASWGGIGILFNKPVAYVFIRPERYTYEFIEKFDMFTLSFLGKEHRDIYNFCGSKSGKYVDKVKETGLKPIITDGGNVMFEQSRLTFECKKLYATNFVAENFLDKDSLGKFYNEKNGFHKMYIVEIVNIWHK